VSQKIEVSQNLVGSGAVDELWKVALEVIGVKKKWLWTFEHFDGRTPLRAEEEL
jgi:hypothetical protein